MKLDEFISESLQAIIRGIEDAQKAAGGGAVNAGGFETSIGDLHSTIAGVFTSVKFDVAVTAVNASQGSAKASIAVVNFFSAEAGVGAEGSRKIENRLSFAVPLRIADGEQESIKQARQAEVDAYAEYEGPPVL